jgi:hypothetical protein
MFYRNAILACTVAAAVAWGQDIQPNSQSRGWREANTPQADVGSAQGSGQAPPAGDPSQLTLPAGTWISVRTDQVLSSDHNLPGDAFSATLAQPLVANGFVVARRGQILSGRVADAVKAGRVKGTSRLALELTDVTLADGQNIPVHTQLVQYSGGTSRGRDAAAIGTTTGIGAAVGAAAAGGVGAGIGAGAGAAASTIGVLLTRGRPTEVYPESLLTFRTTEPITISTDRSAVAFEPVRQEDYAPDAQARPRLVRRPVYRGYPYPPYPYPYFGAGVVIVGRRY